MKFGLASVPVLERPGLHRQLPRRQVLQPPLREACRRPVAQQLPLAGLLRRWSRLRLSEHALIATPVLTRRIGYQVDKVRFVGQGCLPAKRVEALCARIIKEPLRKPVEVEGMALPPIPHIDEVSGDRRRGGHRGRDQMRAALEALSAFEVAVRCRGAALFRA